MPWGVFCHLGSPFPAGKSPCLLPAPHQQALSLCSDSSGHIQVSGAARGLQVVPKTSHRLSAFGWRHCGLGTPPVGSGYMEGGPLGAVGTEADVLEGQHTSSARLLVSICSRAGREFPVPFVWRWCWKVALPRAGVQPDPDHPQALGVLLVSFLISKEL